MGGRFKILQMVRFDLIKEDGVGIGNKGAPNNCKRWGLVDVEKKLTILDFVLSRRHPSFLGW